MKEIMTVQEVCAELSVSKYYVKEAYKSGKLRGMKMSPHILRFRAEDVRTWVEGKPPGQDDGFYYPSDDHRKGVFVPMIKAEKEVENGLAPKPTKKVVISQGVVSGPAPIQTPNAPQVLRSGEPGEYHFGPNGPI